MYQETSFNQPDFPDFHLPFGGKLNPENRWVILRELIPWQEVEHQYKQKFSSLGPKALKAQVAFGALIIKERLNISDREAVAQISENPYLQYFLGFREFLDQLPFDSSSFVHFRKRFNEEMIMSINENLCLNDDEENKDDDGDSRELSCSKEEPKAETTETVQQNQGKLLMDATCIPADITYPTDMKLLNDCREKTELIIDKLYAESGLKTKPRTYRKTARKNFLNFIKNKNPKQSFRRASTRKQLCYLRRNLSHIDRLQQKVTLSPLENQLYKKLVVINEIYRQQKDLYDRKSTRISDRIVSLSQPHVRPIVRGKSGKKYEFGAKISISVVDGFTFLDRLSWDAYNESEDLPHQVEAYKRRFGQYPESVHADQIYRNRSNIAYCKERGIRLSGKPLGRPPKDKELLKEVQLQTRQDEADRVAVEGKFGQAKRRFTLARILKRLSNTAQSTIALVFFIMNLEQKLSLRACYCFYQRITMLFQELQNRETAC